MKIELDENMNQELFNIGALKSFYFKSNKYRLVLQNFSFEKNIKKNVIIVVMLYASLIISFICDLIKSFPQNFLNHILGGLVAFFLVSLISLPFILELKHLKFEKNKIDYANRLMNGREKPYLFIDDLFLRIVVNDTNVMIRSWEDIYAINIDKEHIVFLCTNYKLSFFISHSHYKELEKILKKLNKIVLIRFEEDETIC